MNNESRNALAPETELEGYRIESVLGAGGFGITYKATEILLGRLVAIKEFLPSGVVMREADGLSLSPIGASEARDFEWGMERFRAEAQTLVAFRHTNIVSVLRYFETNGTGYLVMEFVQGQTLGQLLGVNATLDESEICEILDPLLNGLEAVHRKGFLHRDIKPANIFIRADGSPVLIDFGAARLQMGQHSKSLTSIVSAGFAPYEQYDSGAEQGPWTDLYGLGGVLYRCVTGNRPPDAPSRITALVNAEPDPLRPARDLANGGYSDALLHAIDSALAVRSGDRPQTVNAFRALAAVGQSDVPVVRERAFAPDVRAPDVDNAQIPEAAFPTLIAGNSEDDQSMARAIRNRFAQPKILASVFCIVAAMAVIALYALQGDDRLVACRGLAQSANVLIKDRKLRGAENTIKELSEKRCPTETLTALRRAVGRLKKSLAAEAKVRKLAEEQRQAAEKRRKDQSAEKERLREQAAEAARRKKAEEERRKQAAEKARLEKRAQEAAADAERRRKALEEKTKRAVEKNRAKIQEQDKAAKSERRKKALADKQRKAAAEAARRRKAQAKSAVRRGRGCPANASAASYAIWPRGSVAYLRYATGRHPCGRTMVCNYSLTSGNERWCRWR